jgi:hypothetical protein
LIVQIYVLANWNMHIFIQIYIGYCLIDMRSTNTKISNVKINNREKD